MESSLKFEPQDLKIEWELTHDSLNNYKLLQKRKERGETITSKEMLIKSLAIKNESKNSLKFSIKQAETLKFFAFVEDTSEGVIPAKSDLSLELRLKSIVFEKCKLSVTEGLGFSQKQSFGLSITGPDGENFEKEIQLLVQFKKRHEAVTINPTQNLSNSVHGSRIDDDYFSVTSSGASTPLSNSVSTPNSLSNSVVNSDIKSILKKSTPLSEKFEMSPSPRSDGKKKKVVFNNIEPEPEETSESPQSIEKSDANSKSTKVGKKALDSFLVFLQDNIIIFLGFLVCMVYSFFSHVSLEGAKIIALCYWVGIGACQIFLRLREQKLLKKETESFLSAKPKND